LDFGSVDVWDLSRHHSFPGKMITSDEINNNLHINFNKINSDGSPNAGNSRRVMGSIPYLSPEQIVLGKACRESDIWA